MAPHVATASDVEQRLTQCGALLTGQFQLTSGRHSDRYVQCALLLAQPEHAQAVGKALAERLALALPNARPDLVVGPALCAQGGKAIKPGSRPGA